MKYLTLTLALTAAGCSLDAAPEPTASFVTTAAAPPIELERAAVNPEVEPPAFVDEFVEEIVAVSPVVPSAPPVLVQSVPVSPSRYTLRRGETLAHFARWAERPVEDVASSSHLDLDGTYAVGTELALVLTDEERSAVEARRDAHHQRRARNYLASRSSTATEFYPVRTGDSAWVIARERLGMPVWMLESLNPSVDLDRLRPGQELLVPVFQDIVVQADPEVVTESDRVEPSTPVE